MSKKFLTTSDSLLKRAVNGEGRAWAEVANTYHYLIYSWAIRNGLSKLDAEHIANDVIREAWKARSKFERRGKGSFRKWLKAIYRILLKSFLSNSPSNTLSEANQIPQPDDDFDNDLLLLYERVSQLIQEEFSPLYCQVMWKVTQEGMSRQEVAREYGITENLVSVIKGRVRRRVQELMSDEYED